MTVPWLRHDLDWADLVVDTRLVRAEEGDPHPDPSDHWTPTGLPDRFATQGFYSAAHAVSCYLATAPTAPGLGRHPWSGGRGPARVLLVRIVGGDGRRVGFIFPVKESHSPVADSLAGAEEWLPWIARALNPSLVGGRAYTDRVLLHELAGASVGHLHNFLAAPAAWDPDVPVYGRDSLAWALAWASVGATHDDAAYLFGGGTSITSGTPQHASLLRWATGGYRDPAEVADWIQGDVRFPSDADVAKCHGVTPQMAKDWSPVLPASTCSEDIARFATAGWHPEAVMEMVRHYRAGDPEVRARGLYGQARLWLRLMSPERASLYLRAGFTPVQAEGSEFPADASAPPTNEQLNFLAAMRPIRSPLVVFESPVKVEPFTPVFGAVAPRMPSPAAAMARMGTAPKTATPTPDMSEDSSDHEVRVDSRGPLYPAGLPARSLLRG